MHHHDMTTCLIGMIAVCRKDKGLNGREVSRRMNKSLDWCGKLERGTVKHLTMIDYFGLAEVLDFRASRFIAKVEAEHAQDRH